ncbi:MAG: glycosyltransferase family 4 protein [Verrucomicrobiota bacterium]
MRIVQITTDSREHYKDYQRPEPYFGTAPQGLLDGFTEWPDAEIHVISCSHVAARSPEKLAPNIWFHQPLVGEWGWGRTLFAGSIKAVRGLVREIQPDIVHGQGTERDCAMAAVLSGHPNVLTIHGNMRVHAKREENRGAAYYKLAAALEGFCLKRTNGVVAISRYTEELVKGLAPQTWFLPNAVDRRYFEVKPTPAARPRILFVGSICERKNPIGLIKACEPMLRSGECTIAFAGDGDRHGTYRKEFEYLLETLPGLELLGFLGRDALGEEFSRTSILVLPTFEDNCPMVVLEGMAAGLPVAASRVGGVPDLITHDFDGVMFDPHDLENMRSCLEQLVRDPAKLNRLGTQGRISAWKQFHPKVVAGGHLEIYRNVLGK